MVVYVTALCLLIAAFIMFCIKPSLLGFVWEFKRGGGEEGFGEKEGASRMNIGLWEGRTLGVPFSFLYNKNP